MTFELIALFSSNGSALADSAWSFHKKSCNGIITFPLFWSSKPPSFSSLFLITIMATIDN